VCQFAFICIQPGGDQGFAGDGGAMSLPKVAQVIRTFMRATVIFI
jgi:hypothetical protein